MGTTIPAPHVPATPATRRPAGWEPGSARDRAAKALILASGVVVFALLAWVHLGLGALVEPPAPTVAQQTASAGDLRLTLALDSGQLTAAGPNTLSLAIVGPNGQPVADAHVVAHLTMLTMAMTAPDVTASSSANGRYLLHPAFAMAGSWRLTIAITRAGHPPVTTTFDVTARWR